jgi:hypothetical protein
MSASAWLEALLRRLQRGFWATTSAASLIVFAVLNSSCGHSSLITQPQKSGVLSTKEAADLAAHLANEECQRLYKCRPFEPGQHPAVMANAGYTWGGLDPGAPRGYSALVTFSRDGSEPKVEVYFSSDQLVR